ncbi:hypothetical protein [Amycolatopsis sp. NPDC051102]|uniref:hypothetical protein n=1 Tax=Amycolatopsis sp. NPDC051102 TaxID=3155163 RepID=UPI003447342E
MRLVRLERQQSRVADDVRAALASLGRGNTMIGGIALIGVGSVTERPIEAVVLLPHGVIIVIGVDLPDPALRLEAPLGEPWKADGWPLVADDDAINPATEALDLSQACERRIASLVPGTAPVGTIIAVGPYVETVDQPAADLTGPVRVLHPTPTTMLAATVSLATAHRPRSVDQVRALIEGLAPEAPEFSDEVLLGEGFSRMTDDSPPESLWDDGPAVAARPEAVAVAAGAAGVSEAVGSDAGVSAGVSGWRTETPAAAVVTESLEAATEASPAEVVPPAEEEPEPAEESSALPVFPGAGTLPRFPGPAEAPGASTETLDVPAATRQPAEAEPEIPRFPGPEQPAALSTEAEAAVATAEPAAETEQTDQSPAPQNTAALPDEAAPADPAPTAAETGLAAQTAAPPEPAALPAAPADAEASAETGPATSSPTPERPESPQAAAAKPSPYPRPRLAPTAATSRTVRWVPVGAIAVLVVLVVAAIVVASSGDGTAAAPAAPAPVTSAPPVSTARSAAPVRSLDFALRAAAGDQRCASHAFGDAQASLQQTSCSGVRRASYAATIDGRAGAVTVGVVAFPDAAQAAAFKAIADTPGGGGILDLATETGQWGATPAPRFENAAYASKLDGSSVRLVQAVWAPGPSTADDPGLVRAAKAALDLPAQ